MSVQRESPIGLFGRVVRSIALVCAFSAVGCAEEVSAPRSTERIAEAPRFALGPGQVIYIVEDIDLLSDGSSEAWAINNGNRITGWRDWGGVRRGFIRLVSTAWNLSSASFPPFNSVGYDLNDASLIVGSASFHAARWLSRSQIEELTHRSKSLNAKVNGVNSIGYAVGVRTAQDGKQFLAGWDAAGKGVDLMSARGNALTNGEATDINSSCAIVGWTNNRPFHLSATSCLSKGSLVMLPLLPGDTYGAASAINDAGMIVGYSYDFTAHREAVLWTSATAPPAPLGILPGGTRSYANDINENGTIVGTSEVSGGKWKAFRRRWGGGLVALPMLQGAQQSTAVDLNDAGHAVGWVEMADLKTRAVAWWVYQAPHVFEPGMFYPPDPITPNGLITIDLLSSKTFQPTKVDLATVTLGNDIDEDTHIAGQKEGRQLVSKLDLNKDGLADLRISFYARDVLTSGDMKRGTTADLVFKGTLIDRSKAVYGKGRVTIS